MLRPRVPGILALIGLSVLALTGCGRVDELVLQPPTTAAEWCAQRPCVDVGTVVLAEPLGTVLVFLLAGLWLAAGAFFAFTWRGQRSRAWLATALVLGGIGAAQAGVSYQAFGYELKCADWDLCRLTDGFEIGYSVTQAVSVNAMLVAVGYACTQRGGRRAIAWYAAANSVLYIAVTAAGILLPSAALLSFEVLLLFAVPGIVLVLVLAARRWRGSGDPAGRSLVLAAVLLVAVQGAYFAYYAAGITAALWQDGEGWYLSANDILHVGMMLWLAYLVLGVGPRLRDLPPGTA